MTRITFLLLFLVLCGLGVRCQENANSPLIYRSVDGLNFLTDNSQLSMVGVYRLGAGLSGYLMRIDSNGNFKTREFSCLGGGLLDSGICVVYKTGRIGLRSKKDVKTFDVVKFSHYYFCISPEKRAAFIKEFRTLQTAYKNVNRILEGETVLTSTDLRVRRMMNDYYVRDLQKQWRF